jgi:hypothetical protein
MITLSTIILIISVWILVVLFLCALVHNGAIRERVEYDRPFARRKRTVHARRPASGDDADNGRADSPEIHGPPGRKRTP